MAKKVNESLFFGIMVWACSTAGFAQSRLLSLPEVVAASGTIFSGKVTKVWSERETSTGFIVTYTQVKIDAALRGVEGSQYIFKQYGGSAGGLNVFAADMSYFSLGEEIVAFLYPASALGFTSPIGTSEGKLLIQREIKTGKKMVAGNLLQTKLIEPLLTPNVQTQTAPAVEYERFISLVREMVNSK